MRKIIITASPNGESRVEAKGFQGVSCQMATAPLEAALGDVVSRTPTAEAFEAEVKTEIQVKQE